MSWVSDSLSDMYSSQLKKSKWLFDAFGAKNAYTDFIDSEIEKSDLRGAEATSFISGLPIVGGLVKGVEGIQQLEDLYKNTGKTTAYPGSSGPGAQGIAQAGVGIARKIEDGLNDLGEYYAGDPNLNDPVNVNGRMTYPPVQHGTSRISKYGGF